MKYLFSFLFCAAALILSSCSEKDSDESGIDLSYLQGKWEAYQEYLGDTGETVPYKEYRDVLEIGPNTITATTYSYENEVPELFTLQITYTVQDNILSGEDEDGEIYTFRIELLTESEFVYSYEVDGDGETYRNKTYYRRIG